MKPTRIASIIFLTICAATSLALGQTTVTTDPVGFVTGTCKIDSDTVVSVPLSLAPEYIGTISATPTVNSGTATVVASGTMPTGWTTNQFAALHPSFPTYYIKFTTGSLNGKYFSVTANDTTSISFDTNGDTVSGAVSGDTFSVIKYWTLGSLFPPGIQTTFSQAQNSRQRLSLLGLPNITDSGYNLAPNKWYLIVGTGINGKWYDLSNNDATNVVLNPENYFIVRHMAGKVTTDTTYSFVGQVNTNRVVTPLSTESTKKQDNYVVIQRPVNLKLSQLGLSGTSGFIPSDSLRKLNGDQLLVFENKTTGPNKAPTATFVLIGSDWFSLSGANSNDYVVNAGTGIIIRKAAKLGGTTDFWTNDPTY